MDVGTEPLSVYRQLSCGDQPFEVVLVHLLPTLKVKIVENCGEAYAYLGKSLLGHASASFLKNSFSLPDTDVESGTALYIRIWQENLKRRGREKPVFTLSQPLPHHFASAKVARQRVTSSTRIVAMTTKISRSLISLKLRSKLLLGSFFNGSVPLYSDCWRYACS